MASSDRTKLQVNFKVGNDLINIYAESQGELEEYLTVLSDTATLIHSTAQALNGSAASNTAYAAQALGGTVVTPQAPPVAPIAPTAPVGAISGNSCKHGALVWRESKPGAPKQWKGFFCPSPKGTPDQCEPKFVN